MSDISATARPSISHGFRLQWEPAQNSHVLLYPEGMVKLNASAAEIVRVVNALNQGPGQQAEVATVSARLVADDRTNSVLISGEKAQRLRRPRAQAAIGVVQHEQRVVHLDTHSDAA